jgi:nickel/cobalt transporter (NicO) family protein
MNFLRRLLPCLGASTLLWAHPMGNFSVSHYVHIQVSPSGAAIRHVLDLAEIPTFELYQQWNVSSSTSRDALEIKAAKQAREWARNLAFSANGRAVVPHFERASLVIDKGAGDMPIMRISSWLRLPITAGTLEYRDNNYPGRAGWKEVVIAAGDGTEILQASHSGTDRSNGLTAYPQDPTVAPPQDLGASLEWSVIGPAPASRHRTPPITTQPAYNPTPSREPQAAQPRSHTSPVPPQAASAGTVVRGDYLSRLLHRDEIGLDLILAGIAVAFGLGAVHALSPGHGKTIVAAYLVGTRGTVRHALFLGGMVTFTHTVSVFLLGLTTLFLSQYVVPEKIYPILGAISGLSIVWIGGMLLYKRALKLRRQDSSYAVHSHSHGHGHAHGHSHEHAGDSAHSHAHGLVHDHGDGRPHSHLPEGDVTMGSLIALGASGGLVPCPSALVLLLSSIALGRVGLGMLLLVGFSAGLALVLMGIGVVVLYAKHLLPDSKRAVQHPAFRLIPVVSAAIILCVGLVMTGVSLGVIRPERLIG